MDSDRLCPSAARDPQQAQQAQQAEPAEPAEPATLIPSADGPRLIESPYGHDGFLIETGQVGGLIREPLGPSPM